MKKLKFLFAIVCCCFVAMHIPLKAGCSCKGCCSCKSCSSSKKSTCSCGSANCSECSSSRGSASNGSSWGSSRPSTSFLDKDSFSARAERSQEQEKPIDDEINEVFKRLQNEALVEAGDVVVEGQEESQNSTEVEKS